MLEEPILVKKRFKHKYIYFSILSVFLIIGVSYALILFVEHYQSSSLELVTDLVTINISEQGNVRIDNAIGQKDSDGINNSKTTFNIINDNNIGIKVVIKLIEQDSSKISINNIRSGVLDRDNNVLSIKDLNDNNIVYEFYLDKGESVTLYSTLWLDYYYSEYNKKFVGKYNIEVMNIDEYGYMYLTHLVGKSKGLYAINEDGTLNNGIGNIKEYRYSGLEVDNYVMFNNELWRIIGIVDDNIKLVKDTNLSASKFGSNNIFEGSTVEEFLNNYYDSINEEERKYITKKEYNVGSINIDDTYTNILSNEKTSTYESYIGLINASDYLYSTNTSYYTSALNSSNVYNNSWLTGTYLTINPISESTTNILGINNKVPTSIESTTTTYNVKPCIYLRKDVSIVAGNGTQEKPYELKIINELN